MFAQRLEGIGAARGVISAIMADPRAEHQPIPFNGKGQ